MYILLRRRLPGLLLLLGPALLAQSDPNDAPTRELLRPDTPAAKYLREHPGATALKNRDGQLRFRNPDGTKTVIFGSVTRRDLAAGEWVPNAPALSETKNGWRLDGTAKSLMIRKTGASQHSITQSFTSFDTKRDSTLVLTVPSLVYDGGLTFHMAKDGLTWNVTADQTGSFDLVAKVSAKRGRAATYTFDVSSSEALSVDQNGNLTGNPHVNLTRAVMIPKIGARVLCSPWTWSKKDGAAFTCDDSKFRPDQLPYLIDPSTHSLTDSGTYHVDSWSGRCEDEQGNGYPCSGGYSPAVVFNTAGFLPAGASYIGDSCSFHIQGQNGGSIWCNADPLNNSGSTTVRVGITCNGCDGDYSVSGDVNNVTLSVTMQLAPVYSIFVGDSPSQPHTGPLTAGSSYYIQGNVSDADGDSFGRPEVLISAGGASLLNACAFLSPSLGDRSTWFTDDGGTYIFHWDSPSNSQCGQSVTPWEIWTWFKPAYAGTRNVYMRIALMNVYPLGVITSNGAPFNYVGQLIIQLPTAAAPTFNPGPGTYATAQSIAISSATSGASIRYTIDGSTPTSTVGTLYSGPVFLAGPATLKAIAYGSGYNNSSVASGTYSITPAASAPTFSPAAGIYTASQFVTLSTPTPGASIRYTTDGSNPSSSAGTIYSGPIALSATTTVKAVAYAAGLTTSAVSAAAYTIVGGGTVDGRRVGVRGNGTYWGAAGEQIDMLSGNLNF